MSGLLKLMHQYVLTIPLSRFPSTFILSLMIIWSQNIETGNIPSGVILLGRIMMYNLLGGAYLTKKTNNHEV